MDDDGCLRHLAAPLGCIEAARRRVTRDRTAEHACAACVCVVALPASSDTATPTTDASFSNGLVWAQRTAGIPGVAIILPASATDCRCEHRSDSGAMREGRPTLMLEPIQNS